MVSKANKIRYLELQKIREEERIDLTEQANCLEIFTE